MKKKHIYYLLIYASTVLYLFLFYDYGINLWDEGITPHGAVRILQGDIVSKDFLGYAPGRYYLFALLFHFFGIDLLIVRAAIVYITALMPLLGYLISKEIMGWFAVLPFFFILSAPSVYYSRFFPFFTLLNMAFLIKYLKNMNKKRLFICVFSIIITLFFRVDVGLLSIFCLFVGIVAKKRYINKKRLSFVKVGFVAAIPVLILMAALYVLLHQDILSLLRYRIYHIFMVHSKWGNPFPELFSLDIFQSLHFFEAAERLLFYAPLPVYILLFCISIKRIINNGRESDLYLLIISLFGLGTFTLVLWRAGFDNLLRVLPPFYILISYLLFLCCRRSMTMLKSNNLTSAVKGGIILLFVLIIPISMIYNFTINHGFYAGSIGVLQGEKILLNIKRAEVFANPVEAGWIDEIVSYINENTKKDDYIFAAPLNPLWYFLTDRKNPTFYEWILPGSLQEPEKEQREMVDTLKKKRPKIIVVGDIDIDGKEDRRFSNYAPYIYMYIEENYYLVRIIGIFQIRVLKEFKTP